MQYRPTPHTHETLQISEHHAETHTKYPSTTPRPTSPIGPASPLRLPLTHQAPSHKCRGAKKRQRTQSTLRKAKQNQPAKRDAVPKARQRIQLAQPTTTEACTCRHARAAKCIHTTAMPERFTHRHSRNARAAQDTKTPMQPSHRNARAVHGQAQPQCPSGSGTTNTPQCPSGPWTSAAAMPERLRDNHAPATPQCHGQAQPQCPSGLGTLTQPAHRNARAVHASNPQCPIGRGATTGGSTKDKRAQEVRPQVSRVVSSPAAARARPSNLVRDGR